ncbi:UDP-3-O-(3-hydroxymyristoyl)glucosamine N-acyltransferase [Kamptonema cortianum]|nr:UDP-3-O-(3-hydroxymyristoyl)glucosamine N-acyltransferase [Geitlerinema splendidum]MDK3161014.1 UDP-3-O-(3-hydroxymyristoyl)glucosamine N-acyltransferase [Kamptonema cortianum]
MANNPPTWTLGDIVNAIGGDLIGAADIVIERPVPAGTNDPNGITFATDQKYLEKACAVPIGAVIAPSESKPNSVPIILHPKPREAFGHVLHIMSRPIPINEGIHPTAVVSPDARISMSAKIGAYVVIESGSVIEDGVTVHPHCFIGDQCHIREESIIYPNVTLYQDISIGKRCIVHAGCVLGADGFGFAWDGERRRKIPQVGGIILEDDVEIGANSTVDRATCGNTVISVGTKLDNLIHVAHNVTIGDHCVLAAQVGIAGSSTIGNRVIMGGQSGVGDHVTVVDDVVFGGRTGTFADVPVPGEYFGLPPLPVSKAMRAAALQNRLPEIYQRLRALERKFEQINDD